MFTFDNTYVRDLPGFYTAWQPARWPAPRLAYLNHELAATLGLNLDASEPATLEAFFSGNVLPEGAEPVAQVYAGHQFGHFNPQLGDGRALLIGEVIDRAGLRFDISFKGSGQTPYSRRGDGKAALGPMLREALISEALFALGVPTTRALAVVTTGEAVYRDTVLPGAVLTRVAASHIRVGTFEFFAARGEHERVRQLADYAIARHYPELSGQENRYLAFLRAVCERQAVLIAHWMSLGFIHGVMNTDNMSIAGETIDYGPCAFMDSYYPDTVFSSIDHDGRYAYKNQPRIAQWNLARLAETLLPLLADEAGEAIAQAGEVIAGFPARYQFHWLKRMRNKLGLNVDDEDDLSIIEDWLNLLQVGRVDFTLAFRRLADAAAGQEEPLRALFPDPQELDAWLSLWLTRCLIEDRRITTGIAPVPALSRPDAMRCANPWLIPRNHRVEEALTAASAHGQLEPFLNLLNALKQPYAEQLHQADYATPAPTLFTACYQTFCGT